MTNEKIKGLANALRELSPEDRDLALAISRNEPTEPGLYFAQRRLPGRSWEAQVAASDNYNYDLFTWGPRIPDYDPAAHADMQLAWVTRAGKLPTLCGYEACEDPAAQHDADGFGFCAFHHADTAISELSPSLRGELFSLYADPAQASEKIKGLQNSLAEAAFCVRTLRLEHAALKDEIEELEVSAAQTRQDLEFNESARRKAEARCEEQLKALRFSDLREAAAAKDMAKVLTVARGALAEHQLDSAALKDLGQISRARGILTEAGVANADSLPVDVGVRALVDSREQLAQLHEDAQAELQTAQAKLYNVRGVLSRINTTLASVPLAGLGTLDAGVKALAAELHASETARRESAERIALAEDRLNTTRVQLRRMEREREDAITARERAEARHTKRIAEMRDAGWTETPESWTLDFPDTPEPYRECYLRESVCTTSLERSLLVALVALIERIAVDHDIKNPGALNCKALVERTFPDRSDGFDEPQWVALCEALDCDRHVRNDTIVKKAEALKAQLTTAVSRGNTLARTYDELFIKANDELEAKSEDWRVVCEALRMSPECSALGLAEEALSLRHEIQAACDALAPYCDYCDPGKVSLAGVVDMLKSEVLDLSDDGDLSKRIETLAAKYEQLASYASRGGRPEAAVIYRAASQALTRLTEPVEPSKDDEPAPDKPAPDNTYAFSKTPTDDWKRLEGADPSAMTLEQIAAEYRLNGSDAKVVDGRIALPATWAWLLEPLAEDTAAD